MATIGLCMIVKNEAHVIRRCLDSVLPLLDYVLIVDTGSTDGTQQAIRSFLAEKNLPGEVIEEPWRDFAYNRSFALRKLRERQDIDYALMIDADEILVYEPGFNAGAFKRGLNRDLYDIPCHYGNIHYLRPQLFSNRLPFCYKGVLHEYLEIDNIGSRSRDTAQGFFNKPLQDSARAQNPKKFQDDAAVLEKALLAETDPFLVSRYTFYLAQSYRDCGERERALQAYLRRAGLGYWDEEVFVSLLQAARLKEALGHGEAETIQTYMAAYEALPRRLESLHGAARYCRLHDKPQQGYLLAKHALAQARPQDGLFLEPWIYDYGLLDEFSISAYWAGHYRESLDACVKLLEEGKAPKECQARIRANAQFAIDQLKQPHLAELLPPAAAPAASHAEPDLQTPPPLRLNLGCGRSILPGWVNIDTMPLPGVDVVADLEQCHAVALPFENDSVDEFLLAHVIEHVREALPLMQELHRIAKPGASMVIRVPYGSSDDAYEDPTHVKQFFLGSFGYYSQPYYWRADYGYRGDWRTEKITLYVSASDNAGLPFSALMEKIMRQRNIVSEMVAELVAVKPVREPLRELQTAPQIVIQTL